MRVLCSVLALGLAFSLVAAGPAAAAKVKERHHRVHGVVKEVGKDSLTVTVSHGKKGDKTTEDKTFTLGSSSKVLIALGREGTNNTKDGTVADLKPGERVMVLEKDGTVEKVTVMHRHHRKDTPAA